MTTPSPDVELLVHVAAPARVSDDNTYRNLAGAYLAFQSDSYSRVHVTHINLSIGTHATVPELQAQEWRESVVRSSAEDFVTPHTALAFGSQELESLSFRSALDNRGSPHIYPDIRIRQATTTFGTATASSALPPPSWTTPPSQVSDSYPLPDTSLIRVTPTRILERYLQRPPSSSPSSRQDSSESPSSQGPPHVVHIPSSIPVPDSERPSAGVPSSPIAISSTDEAPVRPCSSGPISVDDQPRVDVSFSIPITDSDPSGIDVPSSVPVPESDKQALQSPQQSSKIIPVTPAAPPPQKRPASPASLTSNDAEPGFDVTHISNSLVSSASPSTSAPSASQQIHPSRPAKRPRPNSSEDQLSPPRASSASSLAPPFNATTCTQTLEIRPPSPPVSVAHVAPSSFISPKLDKLAHDLSSRYKPSPHRPLDPLERGYWLVDCTSWTAATRHDTWVFLTNYLHSGLAGWGVWCRRDDTHDHIRFYCWGLVVKHMYLLLYLASGRQIKRTGAAWLDARGDVVLRVAGCEGDVAA